ncbi:type II secretion system F family protein [Desulfitobacterium sp. AusDCA]
MGINLLTLLGLVAAASGFMYFTVFWNRGAAYVGGMYDPSKPQTSKGKIKQVWENLLTLLSKSIGEKAVEELNKVGLSKKDFIMMVILLPIAGFLYGFLNSKLLGLSNSKCLIVGAVLASICLVLTRVILSKGVEDNRIKKIYAVPDLVNQLKVSLIAGETAENALWSAIPFVRGPLKDSIIEMKRKSEGGKEFGTVLSEEIAKTDEPEVLKVWHRLQSYHNAGIVQRETVFQDMAENLARIHADKSLMNAEQVGTPLTLLMICGIIGQIIRVGFPVLIYTMQKAVM